MATTPVDQQRSTLVATALFAAALGIFATQSIKAGKLVETRPVPITNLETLSSFLAPLPDTTTVVSPNVTAVASPTITSTVVSRDPFMTTTAAPIRGSSTAGVKASAPALQEKRQWVVSTILLEGSRKSAIVNNAWVTVGDSLGGGSRLTAVERDHIVITDAKGVRHIVPIQGGELW